MTAPKYCKDGPNEIKYMSRRYLKCDICKKYYRISPKDNRNEARKAHERQILHNTRKRNAISSNLILNNKSPTKKRKIEKERQKFKQQQLKAIDKKDELLALKTERFELETQRKVIGEKLGLLDKQIERNLTRIKTGKHGRPIPELGKDFSFLIDKLEGKSLSMSTLYKSELFKDELSIEEIRHIILKIANGKTARVDLFYYSNTGTQSDVQAICDILNFHDDTTFNCYINRL